MGRNDKIRNVDRYNRKQERARSDYDKQVAATATRIAAVVAKHRRETGKTQLVGRKTVVYSVLARNGALGNKVRVVRDEERRRQHMQRLSGQQQQLIADAISHAASVGLIVCLEDSGGGVKLSAPHAPPINPPPPPDTHQADVLTRVRFVSSRDEQLARRW